MIRPPILLLLLLVSTLAAAERRPVDWVEPRIDTAMARWFFFASASRPFGLVGLSPDTVTDKDWGGGYIHGASHIRCFSHLHEWQLAGVAVLPVTGAVSGSQGMDAYQSTFTHDDEVVKPGYHRVTLGTYGITAELTSTARVGLHRYTFPAGVPGRVIIDLHSPLMGIPMIAATLEPDADRRGLAGSVTLAPTIRRPKPVTVWCAVRFDRPFTACHPWAGVPDKGKTGAGRGADCDFAADGGPLLMQVALSYTSLEGARRNLAAELPHGDFDRVVREAQDEWDGMLSRIRVEGGSEAQRIKFHTDLWHALLGRRIASDADGAYLDQTGPKPQVRRVEPLPDGRILPHHNFDAWWGSHWNLNILWALAYPEVMDGFCRTMVDMHRDGGLIPRGPSGGDYTFVMIGDPAAPFFATAYAHGIRSWDAEAAWAGLRRNAFPGGIRERAGYEFGSAPAGGGIRQYVERGYVPEGIPGAKGMHRTGAAMTLEYAYQDWCLAQLATALGKTDDVRLFSERSRNYRNLWHPESGWMQPRRMDGSWLPDFAPVSPGFEAPGFCEANSAIYTWFVPHDPAGLAALMGGPAKLVERLDGQFRRAEPQRFVMPHGKHAGGWVDMENEPSLGMPYWFAHAGAPWLTQTWVRRVHAACFADITPHGGYNGDEDQGQMGAYSALMAMGLFSLDGAAAAQPAYELTAPIFDRITIAAAPGYRRTGPIVITVRRNSPDDVYIRSASLDGRPWNGFRVPASALATGGRLDLELGPEPERGWGLMSEVSP